MGRCWPWGCKSEAWGLGIGIALLASAIVALSGCSREPASKSLDFDKAVPTHVTRFVRVSRTENLSSVLSLPGAPSTLVAVGDSGAIIRSLDGGVTWSVQDSKTTKLLLHEIGRASCRERV